MTVGMILNEFYPEDIRVTKEISAMKSVGTKVVLLCRKRKNELAYEEIDGTKIYRIYNGYALYDKTLWDTVNAALWYSPFFASGVKKIIKKEQIDVFHVHDLPLANTVLNLAHGAGIKVVLDLHENYPAGVKEWFAEKTNPIVKVKNWLFFGYDRWLKYEKKMCLQADHIITVVEEMKERIIKASGVEGKKITVIHNSEPTTFFQGKSVIEDIIIKNRDRFVLTYVGGFGPHRGLEVPIEAMTKLKELIPKIKLVFVGGGSSGNKLGNMVKERKLQEYVEFTGRRPFGEVLSYMKASNINLIPHKSGEQNEAGMPHKFFQYLQVGQPTLVSDCKPLKRIIESIDGGYVFQSGNVEDFVEKVVNIYKNPIEAEERAKNAQYHSLEGKLNWETTTVVLNDAYADLI